MDKEENEQSSRPQLMTLSLADGISEAEVLVTPMGGNLYRLEHSTLLGEVRYHDIIQAEQWSEGKLKLLQVVARSGLKTLSFIVPKEIQESPAMLAFLKKVKQMRGNWESRFGILILHLRDSDAPLLLDEFHSLIHEFDQRR